MKRKVILYELNEVSWDVIDYYVSLKPKSNLASILGYSQCLTTVNQDYQALQPWITWPTFHKSMYSNEHNIFRLGQDPKSFLGEDLWVIAEQNGLSVGLFGALQSWPAHEPAHGGFYVPDTFSKTAVTFPSWAENFQRFNLMMTQKNSSYTCPDLEFYQLAKAGISLLKTGLTLNSMRKIIIHILQEQLDKRYKARRSIIQVLPSFDLYWKLQQEYKPDLSIFFTNHVASMMHRFWGDTFSNYCKSYPQYKPDPVARNFVKTAMDFFDYQLGIIMNFMAMFIITAKSLKFRNTILRDRWQIDSDRVT